MTACADIIDLLAGIAPGDPLTAVRDQRAQARENAQRSFTALLEPEDPGTFALAERYAVAASWSADDIVSLSQLVAFLTFQLRLTWGLRALAAASVLALATSATSATSSGTAAASGSR